MASRPFANVSDQEIENLLKRADKTKQATKYGMKIFNGKIHVYMHLTYNFVEDKRHFLLTEAKNYHIVFVLH